MARSHLSKNENHRGFLRTLGFCPVDTAVAAESRDASPRCPTRSHIPVDGQGGFAEIYPGVKRTGNPRHSQGGKGDPENQPPHNAARMRPQSDTGRKEQHFHGDVENAPTDPHPGHVTGRSECPNAWV